MFDSNLLRDLEGSATVITVNRRLATYLRKQYDNFQFSLGKQHWKSLDILPLQSWLQRCWNCLNQAPILLTDNQEKLIWKQIITNSSLGNSLINISAVAVQAKEAWDLLHEWGLSFNDLGDYPTFDTEIFINWAKEFDAYCKDKNVIYNSKLTEKLNANISDLLPALPKIIVLAGFSQLTPKLYLLINQLNQNINIYSLFNISKNKSVFQLPLVDQTQEFFTMAQWAKIHIEKNMSVGLVIPDLGKVRDKVERIFSEFFPKRHFNISGGKLLSQYPLVSTALEILKLNSEKIHLSLISNLLSSPFLGKAEQEMSARSALDKELREQGELYTTLRMILAIARKAFLANDAATPYHSPYLANQIQIFLETIKNLPKQQLPSGWADSFQLLLKAWGWPGERKLNSDEYQTLQRWHDLLAEYAALDFLTDPIDHEAGFDILLQLVNASIYQPKTSDVSVQILSALEATNLSFDYLWLSGLDEQSWPPPYSPNPFLPIKLQQKLGMPNASAKQAFDFYQNLTMRFLKDSTHVIASYVTQKDDQTLRSSFIIKKIPSISFEQLNLQPQATKTQKILASQALEPIEDTQSIPLQKGEISLGGSFIFKYQAACPFRAFAKFRLAADGIIIPQLGLNDSERGQLLHNALARIWNRLEDQRQLLKYSNSELTTLITTCVADALLEFKSIKPTTLTHQFIQVEQQRLEKIINNWLSLEKNRKPFKVLFKEKLEKICLDNLQVQLRIDRIDELEDGTHIILDYKTSKNSYQDWFGERPDDPQLPLYCIASQTTISGVAFGQIRANEVRFNGITVTANCLPNVPALADINDNAIPKTWPDVMQQWRKVLTSLARDFQNGKLAVDPKDPATTCEYCDLQPLCRIYEMKH